MKRAVQFVSAGAIIVIVVAGCASTMAVSSYVDRSIERQAYHTFDWGPADALPTGDPRLDRDPFFKDQVQGAVERQLAGRGVRLASSAAPDLLIHFHAHVARRIDPNLVDRAHGYCAEGACPDAATYEAGTLVLDVIDVRTNRLIWRGWARQDIENALNDRDRMARMITDAVTRMLKRFPPAS